VSASSTFSGGEFLIRHVRVGREKRCYFAVTEDGRPVKLQRKPYTECFYTIAMAELHRATGAQKYKVTSEFFSPPPHPFHLLVLKSSLIPRL